jgi:hypothetical protein
MPICIIGEIQLDKMWLFHSCEHAIIKHFHSGFHPKP